jgi:hypothetical protein
MGASPFSGLSTIIHLGIVIVKKIIRKVKSFKK